MTSSHSKINKKETQNIYTSKMNSTSTIKSTPKDIHFKKFMFFQWKPCPTLSRDENYMDMVLLLTRNSYCRQGSMAAIIVRDNDKKESSPITFSHLEQDYYNCIIGVGINSSFSYHINHRNDDTNGSNNSDIHAEINALGSASRLGKSTLNSTIYITMPPCKKCFGSLVASGIKRIVTCKPNRCQPIKTAAEQLGITMIHWKVGETQKQRINKLVQQHYDSINGNDENHGNYNEIEERRLKKREERNHQKEKAIKKLEQLSSSSIRRF